MSIYLTFCFASLTMLLNFISNETEYWETLPTSAYNVIPKIIFVLNNLDSSNYTDEN